MKILLVEKESDETVTAFLLRGLGYEVIVKGSAGEAMAELAVNPYQLVIANINLPEGDARRLLGNIKADATQAGIPVVIISPYSEEFEFEIARCISAGAEDVLSADILETIVSTRVQSIFEKRALREKEKVYLSEIERQKEIVEQRNSTLQEMNELKNRFIGMAAHDLRNPLASIRGFSEILLESGEIPEDEKQQFLEIIFSTSDQMLNLVNELLDVSVIESGRVELTLAEESLKSLIIARIQIFNPLAKKKRITLELDLRDEGLCRIDPDRICQVLDNLISNAIKFSPTDTVVTISLNGDRNEVAVSVADQGPGVTKEDQKRMFRDFQKLAARPTGDEKSTGLGLAIAKRIVEAHHGVLEVNSRPGEGAVFTLQLKR